MKKSLKARLPAKVQASSNTSQDALARAIAQRDQLMNILGKMDEDLYRVSQCLETEQMLAVLRPMIADSEVRRRHISNRISEVVISDLREQPTDAECFNWKPDETTPQTIKRRI